MCCLLSFFFLTLSSAMAYPGSAAMSLSDASACLMFSCSVKVVEEEEEGEKSRGERKKTNKQCSPVVVACAFESSFSPLRTLRSLPRKRRQTHGVARERLHERLPERLDERVGVHGAFDGARERRGKRAKSRCRRRVIENDFCSLSLISLERKH